MKFKRVVISHYGGPEVLQVVEEELREPGPHQVRVKVLTVGVSLADILMREGLHPETWFRGVPFSPGWDMVGLVDKTGPGVVGLEPGQMVCALPIIGGYSQYIYLPQTELISIPGSLDPRQGVCLVLNYVTAYQMLYRSAKVKAGERILIHNAAGGIGSALLQLGRLAGLQMYGTASRGKLELVEKLGAVPIDYQHVNFVAEIFKLTGTGVNVVFDGIGGKNLRDSYQVLQAGGRLVAYGLTATLAPSRSKRFLIVAHSLKEWLSAFALNLWPDRKSVKLYSIQTLKRFRAEWYRQDLLKLFNLLQEHKIEPVISQCLELTQARQAQELVATGAVRGKIVLICNPF
jgi:NADPH2:quinone reductase